MGQLLHYELATKGHRGMDMTAQIFTSPHDFCRNDTKTSIARSFRKSGHRSWNSKSSKEKENSYDLGQSDHKSSGYSGRLILESWTEVSVHYVAGRADEIVTRNAAVIFAKKRARGTLDDYVAFLNQ